MDRRGHSGSPNGRALRGSVGRCRRSLVKVGDLGVSHAPACPAAPDRPAWPTAHVASRECCPFWKWTTALPKGAATITGANSAPVRWLAPGRVCYACLL